MFNSKDGQWYLGWQGVALWRVKHGKVLKYHRPVWFTSMYLAKKGRAAQFEAWKNDPRITGELDYGLLAGKFKMGGQAIPVGYPLGGISSDFWKGAAIYMFPGIVVGAYPRETSSDLAIRIPQPFGDVVVRHNMGTDIHGHNYFVVGANGEILSSHSNSSVGRPAIELAERKNFAVIETVNDSGEDYMLSPLYGQEPVMSEAEAHRLWQFIEKAMLQGHVGKDTDAYLGLGQRMVIIEQEIFEK